jgi:methylmalonyl-CoA/ethylmalonyl-CoA epimerase
MPSPEGVTLHHVGCVVASIEDSIERYRLTLGAVAVSRIYEDPIQLSRVAFLDLPTQGLVQFELVQPATQDSPVARFLEKGGGLHHLCYEVEDLPGQIQWMKSQRAFLIRPPKPAVAFGGRRIAWMRTTDALLIEYLERRLSDSADDTRPPAS